jgi:TonB-dependent SusC/RagA subfamily outer membrane receptor
VDGVPFSGAINSINPADIGTMTVLKDAAATSIYGSRGANGVFRNHYKKWPGQKIFYRS